MAEDTEIKEDVQAEKPKKSKTKPKSKPEPKRKEYTVLSRFNFGSGFLNKGDKVMLSDGAYIFYKSKNKVE